MMHYVLVELNPILPAFNNKKALFISKLDVNLWKDLKETRRYKLKEASLDCTV
jgi:hypothetical protein